MATFAIFTIWKIAIADSKYCCHNRKRGFLSESLFENLTKQSLLVLSTQPKSLYVSHVVRYLQQSNPQLIVCLQPILSKKKRNQIKIKIFWMFFSSADATIFKNNLNKKYPRKHEKTALKSCFWSIFFSIANRPKPTQISIYVP